MSFKENIKRNKFRFRKAPIRRPPENKIDSGVLDQLKAKRLGLTE